MSGLYDYSTTPADNGTVLASGTINIAEGCPAGNLNNAQRQVMADLASFVAAPVFPGSITTTGTIYRDTQYYLSVSGGNPILNFDADDYFQYTRASNKLQLFIAGVSRLDFTASTCNVLATIQQSGFPVWHSGNLTPGNYAALTGAAFTGAISRDGTFYLDVVGGNPVLNFDANDYISYNRATNKFLFYIGGTVVASIDGAGTLRTLGNVIGNTAP